MNAESCRAQKNKNILYVAFNFALHNSFLGCFSSVTPLQLVLLHQHAQLVGYVAAVSVVLQHQTLSSTSLFSTFSGFYSILLVK